VSNILVEEGLGIDRERIEPVIFDGEIMSRKQFVAVQREYRRGYEAVGNMFFRQAWRRFFILAQHLFVLDRSPARDATQHKLGKQGWERQRRHETRCQSHGRRRKTEQIGLSIDMVDGSDRKAGLAFRNNQLKIERGLAGVFIGVGLPPIKRNEMIVSIKEFAGTRWISTSLKPSSKFIAPVTSAGPRRIST
jgi:hypothetical protein